MGEIARILSFINRAKTNHKTLFSMVDVAKNRFGPNSQESKELIAAITEGHRDKTLGPVRMAALHLLEIKKVKTEAKSAQTDLEEQVKNLERQVETLTKQNTQLEKDLAAQKGLVAQIKESVDKLNAWVEQLKAGIKGTIEPKVLRAALAPFSRVLDQLANEKNEATIQAGLESFTKDHFNALAWHYPVVGSELVEGMQKILAENIPASVKREQIHELFIARLREKGNYPNPTDINAFAIFTDR